MFTHHLICQSAFGVGCDKLEALSCRALSSVSVASAYPERFVLCLHNSYMNCWCLWSRYERNPVRLLPPVAVPGQKLPQRGFLEDFSGEWGSKGMYCMSPPGPQWLIFFHRSNEEGDAKEFITESSVNLVKPQGAKWRSTLQMMRGWGVVSNFNCS